MAPASKNLRCRDTHGLHDPRHVAEVGNLVAHRRQRKIVQSRRRPRDGERGLEALENMVYSPYARSNKQNFGRNGSLNRDGVLVRDGTRHPPSGKIMAEEVHASLEEPGAMRHAQARWGAQPACPGRSEARYKRGVLMDGQGAIGTIGRGDQTELATLLRLAQTQAPRNSGFSPLRSGSSQIW